MEKFVKFCSKLLPLLPAKNDGKKLAFSIIYHVVVWLVVPLAAGLVGGIFGLIPFVGVVLAILFGFVVGLVSFAYFIIGLVFSICSYTGAEFMNCVQPNGVAADEASTSTADVE